MSALSSPTTRSANSSDETAALRRRSEVSTRSDEQGLAIAKSPLRPLRCEASLPSQEALGAAAGAPRHLSRAAVSDKMLAERVVHEIIPDNFHTVTEPCHALSEPAPMAAKQLERRTRRTRRRAAVRAVWACSLRARVESGATSSVAGSSSRCMPQARPWCGGVHRHLASKNDRRNRLVHGANRARRARGAMHAWHRTSGSLLQPTGHRGDAAAGRRRRAGCVSRCRGVGSVEVSKSR